MKLALRLLVFGAILAGLPLLAADVTGTWKGQMVEVSRDVTFQFKVDAGKLSGTMSDPAGSAMDRELTEAVLQGDDISFVVTSEYQGMPIKLVVKGKVNGAEMKLRMDLDTGAWGTDINLKKS